MLTTLKTAALIIATLVLLPMAAPAQDKPSGPERKLFDSANHERKELGLAPLQWDAALASAAQGHAETMAQHNAISHQFPGEPDFSRRTRDAGAHFTIIAENVAVGPDADEIHDAWMKSPGHRRNLLDPELTALGVSVVKRDGQLFAVEDFSRAVIALSLKDQEGKVSAQLRAKRLQVLQDSADARRACKGGILPAAGRPQFVLRYSVSSLDILPTPLQQKIGTRRYKTAAVGACPSEDEKGFDTYKVAVILFE